MLLVEYIVLGFIQGLTEFLPVSSSGHLVILQHIFAVQENPVLVSIALHAGTLFALLLFFKNDITVLMKDCFRWLNFRNRNRQEAGKGRPENLKIVLYIIITTLVTGIIGLSGTDFFESLFSQPRRAAIMLLVTAIVLLSTAKFMKGTRKFSQLNIHDAWIMGLVQGISIIPGISRSGITISSLLWRGVDKDTAFRFSFLASIPAVLGALIIETTKLPALSPQQLSCLSIGFLVAFASGLIALSILRKILQRAKFFLFGYYCLAAALLGWLYFN